MLSYFATGLVLLLLAGHFDKLDLLQSLVAGVFGGGIYRANKKELERWAMKYPDWLKKRGRWVLGSITLFLGAYYCQRTINEAMSISAAELRLSGSVVLAVSTAFAGLLVFFCVCFLAQILTAIAFVLQRPLCWFEGRSRQSEQLLVKPWRLKARNEQSKLMTVGLLASLSFLLSGHMATNLRDLALNSPEAHAWIRELAYHLDFERKSLCENVKPGERSLRLSTSKVLVAVRGETLEFETKDCKL